MVMMKCLQNKRTRRDLITYALVIAAFAAVYFLQANRMIPRMIVGQLVPICSYVVMALSLNLVVGVAGDLSLGHAKRTHRDLITYALVNVAFVAVYFLQATRMIPPIIEGQLVPICSYVVMALSLNLVVGVDGDVSLGLAGFMSVGAYTGIVAAMSLTEAVPDDGLRLVIAMIVGAASAALAGFVIGIPVLRLSGDYLAIVTLAFGEIIKEIVTCLIVGVDERGLHVLFNLTGSLSVSDLNLSEGGTAIIKGAEIIKEIVTCLIVGVDERGLHVLFNLTGSLSVSDLNLSEGGTAIIKGAQGASGVETISTFIAGFLLVMVALVVVLNLVRSRTGRAIMAVRDNRIAAESVGISTTKYRMIAFVVSAALAGAAGALFGNGFSQLSATKFDFNTSILILVFVVLGGLGNMRGSIVAAVALTILPEALRQFSDYRMLVYAVVLILVMIVSNNDAIKGAVGRLKARFTSREKEVTSREKEVGADV